MRNFPVRSMDSIRPRYRRLIRAMRRAALLTETEAAAALQMHMLGDNWAGEAVNHFGGVARVLSSAIAMRHALKPRTA